MTTSPRTRLRQLLHGGGIAIAPGCHDGITARLVEQSGFPVAYLSGYCVAASLGEPDVGAISVDAMVDRARAIAQAISIPLIADADSGYGGAYNVNRAVRAFEACGVAAIHLEDQPFPKKCAAMSGKTLVSAAEMQARLDVALHARDDDDFLILARTDALAVDGLDAAIARAQAYEEAGADATIVMSVSSAQDMRRITAALRKPTIVMMVEGLRPLMSPAELREIGYPLVVYPVSLLKAQVHAQRRVLQALHRDGTTEAVAQDTVALKDIDAMLGLSRASDADLRFARHLHAEGDRQ